LPDAERGDLIVKVTGWELATFCALFTTENSWIYVADRFQFATREKVLTKKEGAIEDIWISRIHMQHDVDKLELKTTNHRPEKLNHVFRQCGDAERAK